MSIDTKIDGDPESIYACAQWLRGNLAGEVDQCVADLRRARNDAEWGWRGGAGQAFRKCMDNAGRKADSLRADIVRVADSFASYAGDLYTAQAGMKRARQIAANAGLQLVGYTILDPGPAPAVQILPTGQFATAEAVKAHNDGVTALAAHNRKMQAYDAAAEEANRANSIVDAAREAGRNVWNDIVGKPLLLAGDIVNEVVVGGLAAKHVSVLRAQADALEAERKLSVDRYLKAPGGSAEAKALNNEAYRKFLHADEYTRRAESIGRRVGSKIPVVGVAITAAGIGYDIQQGKPAGKAVFSGMGGSPRGGS